MLINHSSLVIGLVQFTRGLNLTRQRFKGRRVHGGSVRGSGDAASQPAEWQVVPYAAGLLQAFVARHAGVRDRLRFLPIVHAWPDVDEAVEALAAADLVGFSTYVWNVERSLAVARALKARRPEIVTVFGGPQVPDHAEDFLRAHPFVDVACHGEGERTFAAIVDRLAERDSRATASESTGAPACVPWQGIEGVSYLDYQDQGGRFVHQPPGRRLTELDTIPSPYLQGVFDPLLDADPMRRWIMLWETNRGCPFACTFCDWGSAVASKVYAFDRARLIAELEWFAARDGEFIFCCDANFGLLPRDVELARDAAAIKARRGYPRTLSVQNTKNATERAYQVQRILADAGMNAGVTLSLQSLDRHTLAMVRRENISLASFGELQRRYAADGIPTYTDIILGLPGETYDSFANGISDTIAGGQHTRLHVYNCSLLPNAEMSQPAYRERFGIETVRQPMLDLHGPIAASHGRISRSTDGSADLSADDPQERLDIAIATNSMPADEWVRAKTFAWLTDLLHFDRLLFVPFVLLNSAAGVTYRRLVETVAEAAEADAERSPVIAGVVCALMMHARRIQAGGPEFIAAPEWLGICWPADQHALLTLATEWQTDAFYTEAAELLAPLAPSLPVTEAIDLNRQLLRLPFEIDDCEVTVGWNLWEYVDAAAVGAPIPLEPRRTRYRIERTRPTWLGWHDWFEHVIFCHNQKATYLYPLTRVDARTPESPIVEAA